MSKEKIAKQVFLVIIGQMILGAGVGFILFANLGVDAFGVFHSGIAKTFGISFGAAMFFESFVILIAIVFIDRNYINFATVVSLFLVGFTADFVEMTMQNLLPSNLGFILNLSFVFIGCFILAVGLNLYVLADLGVGALDAIAEMITDKTNLEYRVVKVANDLFFLFIGWLLGGSVGVATVITAVALGPIIQFIRKRVFKPIDKWVNKSTIPKQSIWLFFDL